MLAEKPATTAFSQNGIFIKGHTNGPQFAARAAKMANFRPTNLLSLG